MYPLKFKPILKEHVWGGQRLLEIKRGQIGRIAASKSYGESWDISTLPRNISKITNGFLKGNSLLEAIEVYMGDLVGESVFEKYGEAFPLLLKTLTCSDRLSVQVHPDDTLAMERHDSCGKTELWYVVSASPEALLYIGLKNPKTTREEYIEAVATGQIAELIEPVKVQAGDVFMIPSGTIHSMEGDIEIIEIQQPVDITYRIYDWDRVDSEGRSRELHTALAVDAVNLSTTAEECRRSYQIVENQAVEVAKCDYFTFNIVKVNGQLQRKYGDIDSFVIYVCTEGECEIATDGGSERLTAGEVLLLPAECVEAAIQGSATLLEYYVE